MKTYWNGQELDTHKEYKINTIHSVNAKSSREMITELQQKLRDVDNQWNEQCKEIAELKQQLHDAEMRADLAEAAETERRIDYRHLQRTLWLARAERARLEWKSISYGTMLTEFNNSKAMQVYAALAMFYDIWKKVERKCLKKAEQFK